MTNVLIVEDQDYKYNKVIRDLPNECEVVRLVSYKCVKRMLMKDMDTFNNFDVVLLDLCFPVNKGGIAEINQGINVLKLFDLYEITTPVIVVTSSENPRKTLNSAGYTETPFIKWQSNYNISSKLEHITKYSKNLRDNLEFVSRKDNEVKS